MGLISFGIARTDELIFDCPHPLSEYYLLSPCVWKEQSRYQLLLRAVNHSPIAAEKVARIYHGEGDSALHFAIDPQPAIAPGPGMTTAMAARIQRWPRRLGVTTCTTPAGTSSG